MGLEFLEKEESEQTLTEDKLDKLAGLCFAVKNLEAKCDISRINSMHAGCKASAISIETLEEVLKLSKKDLEELKREHIPAILNEVGLSELKLKTGEKVIVEDKYKPSLAKKRIEECIKEMAELDANDIFDSLSANDKAGFNKNELSKKCLQTVKEMFKDQLKIDTNPEVIQALLRLEVPFEKELSIHAQTLKKYCKDRLSAGKQIPEAIKCFTYQETKIK